MKNKTSFDKLCDGIPESTALFRDILVNNQNSKAITSFPIMDGSVYISALGGNILEVNLIKENESRAFSSLIDAMAVIREFTEPDHGVKITPPEFPNGSGYLPWYVSVKNDDHRTGGWDQLGLLVCVDMISERYRFFPTLASGYLEPLPKRLADLDTAEFQVIKQQIIDVVTTRAESPVLQGGVKSDTYSK